MSLSRIYKSNQIKEKESKVIANIYKAPPPLTMEMAEQSEEVRAAMLIIEEARKEAASALNEARIQADDLLTKEKAKVADWWEQKREEDATIIENSKNEGFQAGFSEGLIKAEEQLVQQYKDLIGSAEALLQEAYQMKEQIILESEEKVIELSVAIAEKIIKKELESAPDLVKEMTKDLLKNIKEYEKISVYVSPDNLAYLQSAREELAAELNGQVELMILPDPTIKSGGCLIKTSFGAFDANIDTQLAEVKKILLNTFAGTKNE